MAHVATFWAGLLARMGDKPGDHQGYVSVRLTDGTERRVASADLTVCAEQGSLVGLAAVTEDGRAVFWPAGAVAEVADCAPGGQQART